MGFGQAGEKRSGGCLKVTNWGWWCKSQKRALFIGKTGSYYIILLYCETSMQVLLAIYCERFYWIPLFTILLLFYVFEVGKAKYATQSVLMILTLTVLFQKNFLGTFRYFPENSISLILSRSPSVYFFHYSVCTVISDCNHLFDTSTFTHTVSQEYIIAIENTYLNGVFLKSKISVFP